MRNASFLTWALLLVALLGLGPAYSQHHHDESHGGHTHRFDDVQKWIERFEEPERDEWQRPDLVVEKIGLEPGMNVADIGAGSGYFTRRMAAQIAPGGLAFAVDIEPGFFPFVLERARQEQQNNLLTIEASETDPYLPEGALDVIFLCNTLHHIDSRESYYEKLKQGLKDEGRLVIVEFFNDREIPIGPGPEMRLGSKELIRELEAAGFVVEVDRETLPYQYIVTAKLPR